MGLLGRLHGATIFPRRVSRLADVLLPLLPPRASVLDVGAGDGSLGAALLGRRPDLCVEGLDVLVREDTRIPVRGFDGRTLPFDAASRDVVMFVDVLHHAEDPLRLLAEARRVAATAVVIKDHLREGILAGPTLRFMDWVGNAPHGVRLPYNYWPRATWRRTLEDLQLPVEHWTERLRLYPPPARWLFDRSLHFAARLGVPNGARE